MTLFIRRLSTLFFLYLALSSSLCSGDLLHTLQHLDRQAHAHYTDALISEEWILQSITSSEATIDSYFTRHFDGCGLLWWINSENPSSVSAAGFLGQYCAIFYEEGVVAIRQHDYRRHTSLEELREEHFFNGFLKEIRNLIKKM